MFSRSQWHKRQQVPFTFTFLNLHFSCFTFIYICDLSQLYQLLSFTYFMTKLGHGFSRSQWHKSQKVPFAFPSLSLSSFVFHRNQLLSSTYFMTKLGRGFSRSQWHRIAAPSLSVDLPLPGSLHLAHATFQLGQIHFEV